MSKIEALLLNEQEISGLLSIEEVIQVVELAFRERALCYAQMPPKVYLNYVKDNGDLRTMPAYLERLNISAVKIVNAHPENTKKFGLPSVMATILLIDPTNGRLKAILGGTTITAMRTGAAGGLAAKYMAKKNPKTVGFLGTGVQARTQLRALLAVFPGLSCIKIWDVAESSAIAFENEIKSKTPEINVSIADNAEEAVAEDDIVVTTTPATKPIVQNLWVCDGTHFNCIGADAPGKEELDPAILARSRIVVDDWDQASHSGEINVPITKGIISKQDIWAELSEIVAGIKPGRMSDQEITIFDSTGLGIQDAVTADLAYRKAIDKHVGHQIVL